AVVITHDVGIDRTLRTDWIGRIGLAALDLGVLGTRDEAVHPPGVDIGYRIVLPVRTAGVQIRGVVEGLLATAGRRIRNANCEAAVRVAWNSVRARIRTEVLIERSVLLHDHDHVLDLVDPDRNLRFLRRFRARVTRAECTREG